MEWSRALKRLDREPDLSTEVAGSLQSFLNKSGSSAGAGRTRVMASINPWSISRLCAGSFGGRTEIEFVSGGRRLTSTVPSGELWGSVKDILVFEEYELLGQFTCESLRGGIVVDIGAQVGLYTLKMSSFAEEVISFEPSLKNFRLLTANVERNSVLNVRLRQQALWSSKGRVKFTDGGAGFISELGGAPGDYEVETTTLDDVVAEFGRISLMKMDMEGAEYNVMSSSKESTLRQIDRIVAEVHIFAAGHLGELEGMIQKLRGAGFTLVIKPIPFQSVADGLLKPWRSSLQKCDGRSVPIYRAFLSVVYGATPIVKNLKGSIDTGTQSLLFAYRN